MEQLAKEYAKTLHTIQQRLERIERYIDGTKSPEYEALASAASEIRYILQWIAAGKAPENRREITSRSKLQREKLMDPMDPRYLALSRKQSRSTGLTYEERELLDDLLMILSPKERDALVLVKGAGLSYQEAADYMGYQSKGAVERLVKRATRKFQFVVRKPPNYEGVMYLQRSMFG